MNTGSVITRFKKILVPELNRGQLRMLLRAEYLVDAVGLNKVQGKPFLVSEIEVTRASAVLPAYRVQLGEGAAAVSVSVRLPTGRDQEAIAPLVATNPAAANTRLFSRVVQRWGEARSLDEDAARALPLKQRSQLAAFLERSSPGPDLYLDVACPWCSLDMGYRFDLDGFFLPSAR